MRVESSLLHIFDIKKLYAEVFDSSALVLKADADEWIVAIYFDTRDEADRVAEGINNLHIRPTASGASPSPAGSKDIDEEIPL